MKSNGSGDHPPASKKGTDQTPATQQRLKTLGLGGPFATEEQQRAIALEMKRKAEAQRAAMYPWTEQEVIQYIEAFKAQRPDQYAEYLKQEIERSEIEAELSLEMSRFAASMFQQVSLIDLTQLFTMTRDHVRRSMNLKWEKWEKKDV
jgi:hypothetical protein